MPRSADPREIRVSLDEARRRLDDVSIDRRCAGMDTQHGAVLRLGKVWLLLAAHSSNNEDGFQLLRVADVTEVHRQSPEESVAARFAQIDGTWPHAPDATFDLDSDSGLAHSLVTGRLTVELREEHHKDNFWVGLPQSITRRNRLMVRSLDPDASWDENAQPMRFTMSDVTRVDFDTRYIRSLLALAGQPVDQS